MKSYSDFASKKLQDIRLDIMDIKTPFHIVLFPMWLITFPLSGYNGNDSTESGDIDGE